MELEEQDLIEVALDEPEEDPEGAAQTQQETGSAAQMQQEEEPEDDPEQPPERQEMDDETRRRQAYGCRAREEAEREAAHRAEIDAAYTRAFSGMGDPYHNNRPIRSKEDYDAYIQARQADEQRQRMEQMREVGMDPEILQQLIQDAVSTNPMVQQAGAAVQQARAAMQQAEMEKVNRSIEQELTVVRSIDPEVRTAEDLRTRYPDTWERTLALCQKGVPLSEAFKTANFDALMRSRSAAGRQAAVNAAATKAHLKPIKNNNQGTVTMPRDVLEEFRKINPGHTDAEYARFWAKQHQKE